MRYLLQLGVDLDHSDDDGFTALHQAVLSGFEDVVRNLLEAGSDVNAPSLDCGTPLHLAAMKARSTLLLTFRANANAPSQKVGSPLHCASCSGDLTIVTALLNAGADATHSCTLRFDLLCRMCGVPATDRNQRNRFWALAAGLGSLFAKSVLNSRTSTGKRRVEDFIA